MSPTLPLENLESHLWEAANILRGPVDAADFKTYVFRSRPTSICPRPSRKRGAKILLINAVNEVTRERAQSFLTEDHIERIVRAYEKFADEAGFSQVVSLVDLRAKDGNLSIPLYVSPAPKAEQGRAGYQADGSEKALTDWLVRR